MLPIIRMRWRRESVRERVPSQVGTDRSHESLLRRTVIPVGENVIPQLDHPVYCVLLGVDHLLLQSTHMTCEHRPIDLCHVELVRNLLAHRVFAHDPIVGAVGPVGGLMDVATFGHLVGQWL